MGGICVTPIVYESALSRRPDSGFSGVTDRPLRHPHRLGRRGEGISPSRATTARGSPRGSMVSGELPPGIHGRLRRRSNLYDLSSHSRRQEVRINLSGARFAMDPVLLLTAIYNDLPEILARARRNRTPACGLEEKRKQAAVPSLSSSSMAGCERVPAGDRSTPRRPGRDLIEESRMTSKILPYTTQAP
jgi:hypothetical protein